MKNFLLKFKLISIALLSLAFIHVHGTTEGDSLSMGPTYADDIYYSFENGEVSKAARDTWDIAFYTQRFSSGILINEGNTVELYTYPNGDTSAWNTIDTTGMSTNWKKMYNSKEYFEVGAFSINALGHPDYGWGVYNTVNHSVYGDSLFIIVTPSGIKKIRIDVKISLDNIYHFTYADLDGSNEQSVELDVVPYESKQFVYYSLANNKVVDREPAKESWDILFTKYFDEFRPGGGDPVPQLVTGVNNNIGVYSNNFYPVDPTFNNWASADFDSAKNAIGYDWKFFDFGSFSFIVTDSNYYFVKTVNGDIYKLKFKTWEGSSTGIFTFDKWLVSLSDVDELITANDAFVVYPNPSANGSITIKTPATLAGDFSIQIIDQSGRKIYRKTFSNSQLRNGAKLTDIELPSGFYLIFVTGNNYAESQKLIVR